MEIQAYSTLVLRVCVCVCVCARVRACVFPVNITGTLLLNVIYFHKTVHYEQMLLKLI
jgi:hypothetical protein